MILQSQPNRWSCLPTAFAMCIDVSVSDFIDKIGHDGSEIWFPKYNEPVCRRAYHPQECVNACVEFGYAPVHIERQPAHIRGNITRTLDKLDFEIIRSRFMTHRCVLGLQGRRRHAVAWDGIMIYDPNESEPIELESIDSEIEQLWMIVKSD